MPDDSTGADTAIVERARRASIALVGPIVWNEIGLDFRVGFASDESGQDWVLRVPRRDDVLPRAENEARVLALLKGRLPVEVPDWRVFERDLIAYPRLTGITAVTVDPETKAPTWNIDQESPEFLETFAQALAVLHTIDPAEVEGAGIRLRTPDQVRQAFAGDLARVEREFTVGEALRTRWHTWIDDADAWPPFTTMTHGDLHVGHVLVDGASRAIGILDWTEAGLDDPANDFMYHLMGFGEAGLARLIERYEAHGGRTWPGMTRQIAERLAAFPIKYALFALESGVPEHFEAAAAQLQG